MGLLVVVGFGAAFTLLTRFVTQLEAKRTGKTEMSSEQFNTGGRDVGIGLTGTSLIMAALTAIALAFQFRANRYVPAIYWTAVVLISIMGTLITDNLVDNFGVSLWTTTLAFSAALAAARPARP